MAIQFYLTDAGRNAGLDAENLDLHVSLSHIALGAGKYNAATTANTKTALVNELARYPLNGGGVDTASHTLRFVVNIEADITADIFEIGLFTDTGVLFAVAAITGNIPLARLVTNLVAILTIGLTFVDVDFSNITIVIDPNTPISIALMNQHLAHANPHPQYANKAAYNAHVTQNQLEHNNLAALITAEAQARAQADNQQSASLTQHAAQNTLEHNNLLSLINTEAQVRQDQFNNVSTTLSNMFKAMYPVGSWHGTNSTSYNPATAFAPFFGYQTTWYLWPYVPAGVASTNTTLGQIVALEAGGDTQAASTRIWQRLEDGASPPTYTLTASSSTINEGSQLTFTLTTTGLAQGTQVAWNITGIQTTDISPNAMTGNFVLGSDGKATKTITVVADETNEGTETLKFSLTYIAGKFVNVIINDTSVQLEQIVTISSDAPGLNLHGEFVMRYGQPTGATKAVFIIDSGVEIIAATTSDVAIRGDHWPTGSTREVRILSGAKVIGHGGKGGTGGSSGSNEYSSGGDTASTVGENGGTAILAAAGSPITVNNYGLTAGGGGAGGGGGLPSGDFFAGPGGGGAPSGTRGGIDNTRYYANDGYQVTPATNATATTGGSGGTGVYQNTGGASYGGTGGNGAAIGEAGNAGGSGKDGSTVAGKAGGLAGYIYEGPVTINNISGGQSKGRTP